MQPVANPAGAYRYAPGIPPYSAGVLADDDHVILRTQVVPGTRWLDGLRAADATLAEAGRPAQALCAVELRCPRPHSFGGFGSFNDDYRGELDRRGILLDGGVNPVARTNVAPRDGAGAATSETELYAFSFTMPRSAVSGRDAVPGSPRPSFVIAGAGDLADQSDLRPEAIVGGDADWAHSGSERATAVLDEMEARLSGLGLDWGDTDAVVVYSVEHIGEVLASTVLPRLGPAGRRGVNWIRAEPPVVGLLFEMDTRGGTIERRT